jgi:hypothetical protein
MSKLANLFDYFGASIKQLNETINRSQSAPARSEDSHQPECIGVDPADLQNILLGLGHTPSDPVDASLESQDASLNVQDASLDPEDDAFLDNDDVSVVTDDTFSDTDHASMDFDDTSLESDIASLDLGGSSIGLDSSSSGTNNTPQRRRMRCVSIPQRNHHRNRVEDDIPPHIVNNYSAAMLAPVGELSRGARSSSFMFARFQARRPYKEKGTWYPMQNSEIAQECRREMEKTWLRDTAWLNMYDTLVKDNKTFENICVASIVREDIGRGPPEWKYANQRKEFACDYCIEKRRLCVRLIEHNGHPKLGIACLPRNLKAGWIYRQLGYYVRRE